MKVTKDRTIPGVGLAIGYSVPTRAYFMLPPPCSTQGPSGGLNVQEQVLLNLTDWHAPIHSLSMALNMQIDLKLEIESQSLCHIGQVKWQRFGWYMFILTELWFVGILLLFTMGFIAFSTRSGTSITT